jgi:PmbA protein
MSSSSRSASSDPRSDQRPALRDLAARVATMAIEAGADAAEVILGAGSELSVKVRKGQPELVHEAQSHGLGLRVFVDHRAAVTYSSDFSEAALQRLVRDAVELSRLSEPSPYNELPAREELHPAAQPLPELDLWDEGAPALTAEVLIGLARDAEAAMLAFSPKITYGDGATCDRSTGYMAFACADRAGVAFAGASRGTGHSLSVEALCEDTGGKKRNGSYWTAGSFFARLLTPAAVGEEAARRALGKLGAQKLKTSELPVVFDPDAARALLRSVAGVVSAGAIYRKSSYLVGREESQVASPLVTIVDDPLQPRAPGSRPFDGDGLPVRRNVVIERGVLKTYLYDTYSARQLGRKSNGCAGRGVGGSPYVTTSNFILEPGPTAPTDIVRSVEHGLYVTDMMGFGFNPTTGDFSRGAGGFLIEKGELTTPVSEVTISANFDDICKRIEAVGSDLDRRSATMAPTLLVSRMTVAGR